jgi:pimeloyl-ACP methyl ester carboxylesterase
VLLHGFLCDSRVWRRELNGLSDHFMVVAWDAPGAGASSDPREPFTITDWATCLERFLDAVDVEAPTSWACRGAASWRKSCIACIRTGS